MAGKVSLDASVSLCGSSSFSNIIHLAVEQEPYEIKVPFNESALLLTHKVLLPQLM